MNSFYNKFCCFDQLYLWDCFCYFSLCIYTICERVINNGLNEHIMPLIQTQNRVMTTIFWLNNLLGKNIIIATFNII